MLQTLKRSDIYNTTQSLLKFSCNLHLTGLTSEDGSRFGITGSWFLLLLDDVNKLALKLLNKSLQLPISNIFTFPQL